MMRNIRYVKSLVIFLCVVLGGCSFTIEEKSISLISREQLNGVIGGDIKFPLFSQVAGEDFIVVSIYSQVDLVAQDERGSHVSASAYLCDDGGEKSQVGAVGVYRNGQSVSGLNSVRDDGRVDPNEDSSKVYKIVIFSKWDAEFAAAKGAKNDHYSEFDFYKFPKDVCLRIQYADMVRLVKSNELTITQGEISDLLRNNEQGTH